MIATDLGDDSDWAQSCATDPQERAPAVLSEATQPAITLRKALIVFFLVALFSFLSMVLGRHSEGVAVVWLSNGLLFGIVIRQPQRTWLLYAVLGCVADIAGCMGAGERALNAIIFSLGNSVEIFLAAWLLSLWFGFPLKLSRPKPLFSFLIVGVLLTPALASVPSCLCLAIVYGYPWWTTFRTFFLGDALGMAIIAPLTFAVLQPAFFTMFERPVLRSTLLILTAPALAAAIDFSQTREPLILFLLPALVFVAFRLGFSGTVVGIFLSVCIAIPLTVTGHGPMVFALGTTMLHKIVLVQIVIAIALFTAFPVAALLEDRTLLERSLKDREVQLVELANTDALTGQANRRAFDERLEAEWRYAAHERLPLALLSIDIDLFKSFNDIYGHLAGDDCLRHIAALAAKALPRHGNARLYRLGGEEFAVILSAAQATRAHTIAENIRHTIYSARLEHIGNPLGRQTVSVGVVTTIPGPGKSVLSLLAKCDAALYAAKHNGRNRCEAAA